jgi:hypothetical protein
VAVPYSITLLLLVGSYPDQRVGESLAVTKNSCASDHAICRNSRNVGTLSIQRQPRKMLKSIVTKEAFGFSLAGWRDKQLTNKTRHVSRADLSAHSQARAVPSVQNRDVCGVTYLRLTILAVKRGLHEVPCYRAFDRGCHCFWKYQDCTARVPVQS